MTAGKRLYLVGILGGFGLGIITATGLPTSWWPIIGCLCAISASWWAGRLLKAKP